LGGSLGVELEAGPRIAPAGLRIESTSRRRYSTVSHLTFLTANMDRLIAFYRRVFEARVTLDLEEDGLRHVFIEVGPNAVLHPFQVRGIEPPAEQFPMFQRAGW
jgi:hypothetical protein